MHCINYLLYLLIISILKNIINSDKISKFLFYILQNQIISLKLRNLSKNLSYFLIFLTNNCLFSYKIR